MMIGDIIAGHISIRWNLKGVNYGVQSACATSSHAIGLAMIHLLTGMLTPSCVVERKLLSVR